ncbi:hypothetical protein AOCH_002690 [Aspergillus ochraceoroseus]|uniref:Argonaute complex, subunit Arb1 n=1 Tax=Aspergillus ochraceoroseus TaxID=138278 RepID=A0A0F8XHB4_9EURO|nr:hypothetical protein AOCH_002690 [Aspergillus ochraceoroseus]
METQAEPILAPEQLLEPEKKKRKRSKKSKSKRGRNKPTGFEEYYVDAPMTVEEYDTEKELFDVRMEDAFLRFQKKRRIENDRLEVFQKYLAYGGVDVGPKMFVGSDDRDFKNMDSEQILLARGQTSIKDDHSKLPVDFNAVVKGYLTSYFPYYFNPENEEMIKLATVTIRNYLSYLLYHNVCPEHRENIDEARKSCDLAEKELWKNQQFTAAGPGEFNNGCSILFGGFQHDLYVENNQWSNPKDNSTLMTKEVARKVVKFGLAGSGSDELAVLFNQLSLDGELQAKRVEDIDGFEVIGLVPPDVVTTEFYEKHAPDLNSVGILRGRAYHDPARPRYDMTAEERNEWEKENPIMPEFEFFLEESLLEHCYVGMKVITSVWELNCGLHYFEDIHTAYSSIYTVLPNDLMIGWKKPRDLTGNDEDDGSDVD